MGHSPSNGARSRTRSSSACRFARRSMPSPCACPNPTRRPGPRGPLRARAQDPRGRRPRGSEDPARGRAAAGAVGVAAGRGGAGSCAARRRRRRIAAVTRAPTGPRVGRFSLRNGNGKRPTRGGRGGGAEPARLHATHRNADLHAILQSGVLPARENAPWAGTRPTALDPFIALCRAKNSRPESHQKPASDGKVGNRVAEWERVGYRGNSNRPEWRGSSHSATPV